MEEKVRKYFMAGTDEEVLIGDVINTDVVKEFEDGRSITRELEFKVTEETIPYALELGIIEEREEDELIDFDDELDIAVDELLEENESLKKRLGVLEEKVKVLESLVIPHNDKKTASSKKK